MDLVKLGSILKEEREKKNISIRKTAQELGISHTYISKLENAHNKDTGQAIKPSVEYLEMFSKFFNLDLGLLLELAGYTIELEDLYVLSDELPDDVKALGIEHIAFAKEMKDKEIPLDKVRDIIKLLGY